MESAANPRSRSARRLAIRVALPLLAAYVAYLLAANVFLHTGLARDLVNRKPETFGMAWSGGHTLWPGRVTLREVRMRGHVRRTAWSVEAGSVRGRIALWPLLRKEVRIPWIEAEAVSGTVARAETELPRPEPRPGGWILRLDRIASDSVSGGETSRPRALNASR